MYVDATPPACFLSCINEVAHLCACGTSDVPCICTKKTSVIGCLADICPYGNLDPARDHFLGTCLEHELSQPPLINPIPIAEFEFEFNIESQSSETFLQPPSKTIDFTATYTNGRRLRIVKHAKSNPQFKQTIYDSAINYNVDMFR